MGLRPQVIDPPGKVRRVRTVSRQGPFKGKMDLFSTLTFFPLVLQIGLSAVDPRTKPDAGTGI
jgi:hypothetical protein